ncbi:MAG: T9SS type A sorting domain-containing protein [Bacteroidetes bacterium]|nr:T9SS type A sorting domain-containing protein [Bacteroidota bacterium]
MNVIAGNDLDAVNDTVTVVLSASGAEYDEVVSLISIAIIDDETREIFVTPFDIEIPEGTSSQIKVRLTSEPTSDVIVDIVQEDDLTPSPSFLTFARLDWDTAQPVILTAREDDDQENDRETLLLTASGGDYEDVNKELTITIEDTDVAGISVFPSVLTVSEESSIELSAILNTEPSGDVRLLIPSMGDVVPTPKILTFTSRNWDVLQQVTLTASHDEDEENDRELLTIISSGANYGGYTQDVLVNIVDNDLSTIDLTPDPAPSEEEETTGTIEEGETAEFDIVLREQPSGDVVVEIASSDESLAVMPSRLTFMPSNWNVEQTVMMISTEDDNDENEEVTVTLMASGGGYGRLSQTRRFTIRDQTAVSVQHSESHPVSVQLWGNYPNPFSTMTNVAFDLPEPAQISLIVTDLLGRTVILIPDHWYGVGQHQTLQIQGGELPSGVYYYRLDVKIDGKITGHTKPMMIIR